MKTMQTNNYKESQRELAAGVLKQAERDLRRFYDAPSAIERELYLDAHRWVTSDDSTWPFSFLQVCESLNLTPEDVREDLIGQLSLGTFGRWVRLHGRTIRRLGMLVASISLFKRRPNSTEPTTFVQTLH
jgi:hypothetical protein